MLKAALDAKQVELRGTKDIAAVVDCVPATEMDDRTEYLDYILSAKTVKSVEEAIVHINRSALIIQTVSSLKIHRPQSIL